MKANEINNVNKTDFEIYIQKGLDYISKAKDFYDIISDTFINKGSFTSEGKFIPADYGNRVSYATELMKSKGIDFSEVDSDTMETILTGAGWQNALEIYLNQIKAGKSKTETGFLTPKQIPNIVNTVKNNLSIIVILIAILLLIKIIK